MRFSRRGIFQFTKTSGALFNVMYWALFLSTIFRFFSWTNTDRKPNTSRDIWVAVIVMETKFCEMFLICYFPLNQVLSPLSWGFWLYFGRVPLPPSPATTKLQWRRNEAYTASGPNSISVKWDYQFESDNRTLGLRVPAVLTTALILVIDIVQPNSSIGTNIRLHSYFRLE